MALANIPRPLNSRTGYGDAERLPVTPSTPPSDNTPETLNKWLKTQPWYLEALKAWRISPNSPTLNPTQRLQIQEAATRAGASPASTYAIGNHGEYEDTHELAGKVIALSIGGIAGGVGAAGLLAGGAGAGGAAASSAPAYVGADIAGTAAAGTGAAAGGGVAATAGGVGSWLTSPYGSLISQGISTAGNIYGANKAADASAEAARIQAESFDKALAAAKEEQDYAHSRDTRGDNQYADYLSRLNPYGQTGQASSNRLSQFMGQPAAAQTPLTPNPPPNPLPAQRTTIPATAAQQSAANSFVPTAVKNSPTASQVPQGPGPYANWPVYQAPDGSKRKISPEMAAQADAAGLQRVG